MVILENCRLRDIDTVKEFIHAHTIAEGAKSIGISKEVFMGLTITTVLWNNNVISQVTIIAPDDILLIVGRGEE